MDDPTKALELLKRWIANSELSEHYDANPSTMRLLWETEIFLGVNVEDARNGLRELAEDGQ